ncbi:hypothetical protein [Peteryoungia algae]|uniref:Uncharacterized protein n=1 Tax=Peteryoungia algae TaxID=2919917 RepID=A0ABT0D4L8_9HYPH|nr:hypothetical protein [Rhizobium sp. SSM4.3]MCJ8240358.1 hypothetical protein [Rhizobium sp. SSM4.3]
MQNFDLSTMTKDELDQLIADATSERGRREAPEEDTTGAGGVSGQDVNDPDHGAITTPTPHAVREQGPTGLKPGARVEGTTVKDADEVDTPSSGGIEDAARRVV